MLGRREIIGLGVVGALLTGAASHAGDTVSGAGLGEGPGTGFREMVALPGGPFSAVTVEGRSGLFFLSANGRYAIRGEITDLWSGRKLATIDEVRASADRIDMAALEDFWDDLDPFEFGTGSRLVTVFVDPRCPSCADLMGRIDPFLATHRFRIVPFPALGQESGRLVRQIACAEDEEAARAAVRNHRYETPFAQRGACDLAPLQRRVVTAQILGVAQVPFLIGTDGTVFRGAGPGLEAWLGGLGAGGSR